MASQIYKEWTEIHKTIVEFEDEYTRPNVECKLKGLYLLEQCACDPHTKQIYYWVKVGQSIDMRNRMKGYASDNPAYFLLAVKQFVTKDDINYAEKACQIKLMQKAIARGKDSHEWFLVDEKTFFEIEDKKFDYFF